MRSWIAVVALSALVVMTVMPQASAGSVEFDIARIQYHRGDVMSFEGRATPNGSVHVQIYDGIDRLYSNYSTTNQTGYWIHALRVNGTWTDGRRLLHVTDLKTGDFWKEEVEIVPTPEEVADRLDAASATAGSWAFGIAVASLTLAVFSGLISMGFAAYKISRLTMREAIGKLGAVLSAWRERTWWQLTMTFHLDENIVNRSNLGHLSLRSRRAQRRRILAQKDIEQGQAMIRAGEDTIIGAEQDLEKEKILYDKIAEKMQDPGTRRRTAIAEVLKETRVPPGA